MGFGHYDEVLYHMTGTKQTVGDQILTLDDYLNKINKALAILKAVTTQSDKY